MFLRIKITGLYSFFILLNIFFHYSAATGQMPPSESPSEIEKSNAELIHFGDLIDVDVIGSTEYDWRGTITPEGFLQELDFIEEPVYALCRSEETVALGIARGYAKLLRDPKVRVKILDRSNRPVTFIYGAVKSEQKFQIKRPIHLNELIVFSGGFTENASGSIQIFRPANLSCNAADPVKNISSESVDSRERFVPTSKTSGANNFEIKISDLLKGEKNSNPLILNGDIITVASADPIYLIGGVGVPKQIASRSEMTLTRAIASAGGLSKDADAKLITIFRRNINETKIIEADLDKIISGQAEDIALQAFDIVDVAVKGRGKSKLPPLVKINDSNSRNSANLPLRIID